MTTEESGTNGTGKGKPNKTHDKDKWFGEEEMKGSYFSYGTPGQTDIHTKTLKVVENYFGKRHSCEIADLVTTGVEAVFEDPVRPADDAPKGDWEIYKMELSFKRTQKEAYRQDKAKAFLIIMGQCSIAMTNKLESLAEYADLKKNKDVAGLLRTIKELVYSTDKSQYEFMAMQAKMRNIHNIRMKEGENLPNYLKRFLEQQQATEALWGELIPMKLKGKATAVQDKGKNQYLACLFLAGVDRARFKQTLDDLHNDFQLGKVSYPEDVPSMMNYLSNRRGAGVVVRIELWMPSKMQLLWAQRLHKSNGAIITVTTRKEIKAESCAKESAILVVVLAIGLTSVLVPTRVMVMMYPPRPP